MRFDRLTLDKSAENVFLVRLILLVPRVGASKNPQADLTIVAAMSALYPTAYFTSQP
jgi:hypothetical protein